MRCPSCERENRPDARFCDGCGGGLTGASPAPRAAEPANAPERRGYTPEHLANKILRSRSALEGERKQVTVLFADVKGSMELSEQVDPEEWHKVLDRFFQILTDGVHRFEGTVNQYTGDGIMALFGAPIAHEDHAQRACYAALHLRDQLRAYTLELRREQGLSFSTRMGLHTGAVIVGKIGDDLRMDYTAQGHTVGLAARMEQLAEPGQVYLSGTTADLVRGYFALEDLGEFEVKGISTSVRASALTGLGTATTRLDVSRARGFSHFVGRFSELGELEAALAAAREGHSRVIGISAQAGVGKSRLCNELAQRAESEGVTVLRAHGVAHGRLLPMLPILQLLRELFGLEDGDPPQAAREKIAGRLVLLDAELRDDLTLFFDLMGVPDQAHPLPNVGPEVRRHEVFAALRRLIRAGGRSGATVILLEAGKLARADEIAAALDQAEAQIGRSGWRAGLPALHRARALLAQLRGDRDQAREHWELEERVWRELGAPAYAERAASDRDLLGAG